MIQITPHMRIMVALEPADFRRGIDGLARQCRDVLKADPFSGTLFVFRNRRRTAIKILTFDGSGFWLMQKRLSKGRFRHFPSSPSKATQVLLAHELHVLICGGDPESSNVPSPWRPLNP